MWVKRERGKRKSTSNTYVDVVPELLVLLLLEDGLRGLQHLLLGLHHCVFAVVPYCDATKRASSLMEQFTSCLVWLAMRVLRGEMPALN